MSAFLSRLLFPPTCKGCGKRYASYFGKSEPPVFCSACETVWQRAIREECPRCFRPFIACTCVSGKLKKAGFALHVKLARYGEEAAQRVMHYAVLYMKKHTSARLAERLASELASGVKEAIALLGYDEAHALIVPLPRATKSVRRYGTDQAVVLALALSHATGIAYEPLLYRTRHAREQKELSAKEREKNLADVFASHPVPQGYCVILVDDVVTTGTSMYEAGRALHKAGARDKIAVSLAVVK